jgi:hypothetical protein
VLIGDQRDFGASVPFVILRDGQTLDVEVLVGAKAGNSRH